MATIARTWTVEEVQALPADGNRYEIVGGELFVTPAPSLPHQDIAGALYRRLFPYVWDNRSGHAFIAPADIVFGKNTVVEPDVFVLPLVNDRPPRSWDEAGRLLLAVEVLSPSSARADRIVKRHLYQSEGVPEYWIVDIDSRVVERWHADDRRPEILSEKLEWQPSSAHAPLVIDLAELFREALGE